MKNEHVFNGNVSRRELLKGVAGGALLAAVHPFERIAEAAEPPAYSSLFWVKDIPSQPYLLGGNRHAGVDALLSLMGVNGLKFYRTPGVTDQGGPEGLISQDDVVLIKVNAQWKYRGATNSDVVRGLIQAILDFPGGFNGEVVIVENGQGRGSLRCNTSSAYGGETGIHANAHNPAQSFTYLVRRVFADPRVSARLLDPIRETFIGEGDHVTDGYRKLGDVSYPCFTTQGGNRVELREGIWQGDRHAQNLKLINIPVLKHHDVGGSEITASLKHFYGLLSMADGNHGDRHYGGLGATCGQMVKLVKTPVLNIIDAIWVSHLSLRGFPADTTRRVNQLLAGQDPVALDHWAAKYIIHPIDGNPRHHPAYQGINRWLVQARDTINALGGLYDPQAAIYAGRARTWEGKMKTFSRSLIEPV